MSELRLNRLTEDWVVIAPERAGRVRGSRDRRPARPREAYSAACPFCPGNEHDAPAPLYELAGPAGWALRVLPNKFPALDTNANAEAGDAVLFPRQAGYGHHEVVVDSRRHDDAPALMPADGIERIFTAYRDRYRALAADRRVAYIVVFKNHGVEAGCSLDHPHSQIVATPVVPPEVRDRVATARRYHDEHRRCLACDLVAAELAEGERIVHADEHYVAHVPFAAFSPFHLWVFPRVHQASFGELSDAGIARMAACVRTVLHKVHAGLADPDYNLTIRSAPLDERNAPHFHWYLAIVPRVTRAAGFELGTGMFVNTMRPEEAARTLREAASPA